MKPRHLAALFLAAFVLVLLIAFLFMRGAPQKSVVAVVTYVDHPVLNTIDAAFRRELAQLSQGYRLQGWNAQGRFEELPALVTQALANSPQLIVSISTPVTQAVMRRATIDQPIVYTFVTNPADLGSELTRTNSTGLSDAVNYGANLELIYELFGKSAVIGMPYNPNEANSVHGVETFQRLVEASSGKVITATVLSESDIPTTITALASNSDVLYVGGDNTLVGGMAALVNAAAASKKAVIASDIGSVKNGAIAGVSVDYERLGKETAIVVARVLAGESPKQLPRITIPGDQLVVNTEAAERIGFQIPGDVIARAKVVLREEGKR